MIREKTKSSESKYPSFLPAALALAFALTGTAAHADEIIKYGFSSSMTGPGAIWGKAQEWLCNKAAQEIKESGGIKVKGQTYNIQCIVYDNKYTAAEGTKVAQTLINRDGVKFMYAAGTAPVLATQSLTERAGVLLFSVASGPSVKGPKFPLTFNTLPTPSEITPGIIKYLSATFPQKKLVMVNTSDATGREFEANARKMWEKAGYEILSSDFYDRGTTEFQPIATRLMSFKPDIVNLPSLPPSEAGQILKELDALGFKGLKVIDTGGSADGLMATAGPAGNGAIMAMAIPYDGPSSTEHQRKLNEEAKAYLGESLGLPMICGYDPVYALKAGIEKAQSLDPKDVAEALQTIKFPTFLGEGHFGGKDLYGSNSQEMMPIYITQIVNGKLVEKARLDAPQ